MRRVSVSAPGKVIVHGEHAVVYGQLALAASLGLRTRLTLQEEESAEPALVLEFPSVDVDVRLPMESVERELLSGARSLRSWREPGAVQHERLLAAVDGFVAARAGGAGAWRGAQRDAVRGFLYLLAGVLADAPPARGLRARATSELAPGAGAGSSAAFAVCAAAALLELRAERPREREGERADFGADERELISAWAFNCERIMHGAPSGVDNATCAFGGVLRFRRGAAPRALRLARALRVLLVDSRAARSTAALVRRVAERRRRDARAVDAVLAALGHVAERAAQILEQLPDDDSEDTDAQYQHLAELWDMNHWLLGALGVSHAALDDIRARAARHGLAAKLTGAGGGGYALVLLPPRAPEAAVRALGAELRAAGYGVADALLGGAGVALH